MENIKIAKKLVAVMSECRHIGKNGVNEYHKYKYATAEDVLLKVNESLTKNKIASIVLPELVSMENVTNLKGNKEHLATIKVSVQLIDSESGEVVEIIGMGCGQDAGDKAVMKAQTAAIKYAYMMSLCIATGDDPEADGKTDENTDGSKQGKAVTKKSVNKSDTDKQEGAAICVGCGEVITSERVVKYSMDKYGQPLCMDCQKRTSKAA